MITHAKSIKRTKLLRKRTWNLRNQGGQLVLEYVLLLVVVVSLAEIIVKGLISREQNEPGAIIKVWDTIIKKIGSDQAGEIEP